MIRNTRIAKYRLYVIEIYYVCLLWSIGVQNVTYLGICMCVCALSLIHIYIVFKFPFHFIIEKLPESSNKLYLTRQRQGDACISFSRFARSLHRQFRFATHYIGHTSHTYTTFMLAVITLVVGYTYLSSQLKYNIFCSQQILFLVHFPVLLLVFVRQSFQYLLLINKTIIIIWNSIDSNVFSTL